MLFLLGRVAGSPLLANALGIMVYSVPLLPVGLITWWSFLAMSPRLMARTCDICGPARVVGILKGAQTKGTISLPAVGIGWLVVTRYLVQGG